MSQPPVHMPQPVVVIDTNCVLDLWVFDDSAMHPVRVALAAARMRWLATAAMRDELARVLGYAQITPHLLRRQRTACGVLALFDAHTHTVPAAPPSHAAPYAAPHAAPRAMPLPALRCRDADDQPFIDLAAQWHATLLSKDREVIRLRRALRQCGADVWRPGADAPAPWDAPA